MTLETNYYILHLILGNRKESLLLWKYFKILEKQTYVNIDIVYSYRDSMLHDREKGEEIERDREREIDGKEHVQEQERS